MTLEEQIANVDRCIRDHEAALSHLNEKRRELVNRGNLNKCTHFAPIGSDGVPVCLICKERLA